MATQYNTEPQTTAKVIFSTTSGELDVELWAGQAPATARAFLQLCLDGFYTNQPFSRLVPGFVVQLGDVDMDSPRRSAAAAEEVSSRLKFNRRGLLGAVRRDPTGFFITLESARELDGRATMFGKVVGETVYNVVKMGEAEVNGEVPVFPVKVLETRVVVNPFEDMVARAPPAAEGRAEETEKRDVKKGGKKKDGKKGKGALLSFGEEEEGEEAEVKFAKPKFDARLVVDRRVETRVKDAAPPASDAPANPTPPAHITPPPPPPSHPAKATPTTTSLQQLPPPTPPKSQPQPQPQSIPPPSKSNPPKRSLLAVQKSLLPKTSLPARKRKRTSASTSDDRTTLDALERFRQKLSTTTTTTTTSTTPTLPPLPPPQQQEIQTEEDPYHEPRLCDLHFIPDCLSCTAFEPALAQDDKDNADDGRAGIWGHELRFGKDFAGKDLEWRKKRLEETKGF